MTRAEQIEQAEGEIDYLSSECCGHCFMKGAEWADANPTNPAEVAHYYDKDLQAKLDLAVQSLELIIKPGWNAVGVAQAALEKIRGDL